jgi:hypothetical protein
MFRFLKSFFVDPTRDWKRVVDDSILGELVLNEEATSWDARVAVGPRSIDIQIGGEGEPEPALIAEARRIMSNFEEFEASVKHFLVAESPKYRGLEDEIRTLEIEGIGLWRPPCNGMVFFGPLSEPEDFRLWRCDLKSGKPKDLGWDN